MVGSMDTLIRKYGTEMLLEHDGSSQSIRAFLQESRSKSQENSHREFSALGELNRGLYVYIGPASPMAAAGDSLLWGERRFELRRAEPVMVGNRAVYCWGLCVEKGGADGWGS